MTTFNYQSPGELYYPKAPAIKRKPPITYRRFATAAEALRYAIESFPALVLQGCYMEVEGERYDANQMRELYDSADYPFERMQQ
jgi:hypothetical protein